ncbi:response regulator [Streptomyces sp. NPDC006334]|uniref:response regulator n=1 Tax=Streptomyces sp. NPDC006334 TaxID=3156754 RepID=UPI0033A1B08D
MSRVLLIEDDRAVREGIALALRRRSHEVAVAVTGEEGLERLRSFRPDVVVLDLMLPGMPGLDVCRALRALDQTLPIVMATARGDDEDIVVGLESGADDYVVKPVQARVHLTTLLPPGRTTTRTAGQDLVRVRTKGAQVAIELTRGADQLGELATAQLICTVLAAQGVADRRRTGVGDRPGRGRPRRRKNRPELSGGLMDTRCAVVGHTLVTGVHESRTGTVPLAARPRRQLRPVRRASWRLS